MGKVVDIVNFNADASCLECGSWLNFLQGGRNSTFYQWLNLYVQLEKKVVLGIPGATLADIQTNNPESIQLIRDNRQIFELVLRPFAHDNALLRTRFGFQQNLKWGIETVKSLFDEVPEYFLPPEFMLNSEQVLVLNKAGIKGTFVSPARFSEEARERIPQSPYVIRGLMGKEMNCIPFTGELTKGFLDGIHHYNATRWNHTLINSGEEVLFNWRDGESAFLIPDTVEREKAWLQSESAEVQRLHLSEMDIEFTSNDALPEIQYQGYPYHSFAPWLKEMRMIGFTNKVAKIEEILDTLSVEKVFHWLQIINSDILSAVEKNSPLISIQSSKGDPHKSDFRIWRTERAFEGEEYLTLLKESERGEEYSEYLKGNKAPHLVKFNQRIDFLRSLL